MTLSEKVKPLLDFIAKAENGQKIDYNVVWGGIKQADRPRRLTDMTVDQILAWQDSIDPKYPSEAAGAYQIMEDTLRGLYMSAGVRGSDLYDGRTQDKLATQLLVRRGLHDYLGGLITPEKFANSLAKEWASLPVVSGPNKGRSYYGGDGLNKNYVTVPAFMQAVKSIKEDKIGHPQQSQLNWIETLIHTILDLLRGVK